MIFVSIQRCLPGVIVRIADVFVLIGATFAVRLIFGPADCTAGLILLSNRGTVSSAVDADFGC